MCIISAYATSRDYISIYDEYDDLICTISYNEMGINSGDSLWSDVCANFNMGSESSENFVITTEEVDPYGDVVVFWTYWYDELDTDEMFKFYLKTLDNQFVTLSDSVGSSVYYAQPVYCVDGAHEYVEVEYDDNFYCYYEMCVNCGFINSQEHNLILENLVDPTCITAGCQNWKCHSDGCSYEVAVEVPLNKHTYSSSVIIKQATCTETGIQKFTCEACNIEKTEIITAPGHMYSEATCTTPATCKVCGATDGEALGHYYPHWWDILCQRGNCNAFKFSGVFSGSGSSDSGSSETDDKDNIFEEIENATNNITDTADVVIKSVIVVSGVVLLLWLVSFAKPLLVLIRDGFSFIIELLISPFKYLLGNKSKRGKR